MIFREQQEVIKFYDQVTTLVEIKRLEYMKMTQQLGLSWKESRVNCLKH